MGEPGRGAEAGQRLSLGARRIWESEERVPPLHSFFLERGNGGSESGDKLVAAAGLGWAPHAFSSSSFSLRPR